MGRHSKNNNAASFLTSGERQMLKHYGSQSTRVGRESMRDYDACFLCLAKAREPKSCLKGHIACKECIYENILAQKKDISRLQKGAETQQAHRHDEKSAQEDLKKQQEILEFAQTHESILPVTAPQQPSAASSSADNADKKREGVTNFWLPSQTPQAEADTVKTKDQVLCPLGNDHPLNLKKLISVTFSKDAKDNNICLACRKNLSNAIPMVLVRDCGHVICKPCVQKFVRPAGKCFICEAKCRDKDLIVLQSEGTGFAAKGNVEAKRYELAFKG